MHRTRKPSRPPSQPTLRRAARTTPALWGNPLPDPSLGASLGLSVGVLVITGCFILGCIATSINLPAPGWAAFLVLVALLWYAVSHHKGGAR